MSFVRSFPVAGFPFSAATAFASFSNFPVEATAEAHSIDARAAIVRTVPTPSFTIYSSPLSETFFSALYAPTTFHFLQSQVSYTVWLSASTNV